MNEPRYQGTAIDLGGIRIDAIAECEAVPVSRAMLFPDLTADALSAHVDWMTPDFYDPATDCFLLRRQSWLVRTAALTMVVDCGGGEKQDRAQASSGLDKSGWLPNLLALGVAPDAVGVVVNTHIHPDNVGWNTRLIEGKWVPTFPNAEYLIGRTELAHWFGEAIKRPDLGGPMLDDSVLPVLDAGLGRFVEGVHQIADGIVAEPVHGHTPGQMMVRLTGTNGEAVIAADVMHQPLQVRLPELSTGFCSDRAAAAATRRDFLVRFCGTPTIILPTHFRRGTAGRIVAAAGGYEYWFGVPDRLKASPAH